MSTEEEKYIHEALACNDVGTKKWVVKTDLITSLVEKFKTLCTGLKHEVYIDWDDETLTWLKLSWEPGTLHSTPQPKVVQTLLRAPSATGTRQTPETKKTQDQPKVRYGGPRW